MTVFRLLLATLWLGLAIYTGVVAARHGLNLLPIFFGDIGRFTWPGQFNADFLCFLILSSLWTAWRHNFSRLGLALAPVALLGGAGFLLPYLLVLTVQARGDMGSVLLGARRSVRIAAAP